MTLRLWVDAHGADEIDLYAGGGEMARAHLHPLRGFLRVRDRITTGWLKASLRFPDQQISRPFDPVPTFTHRQPLAPGQVVPVDIALGPSATIFKAEETLRLVVADAGYGQATPSPADSPPPTKRPERQLHPALGPAPGGPPRPPHHSLTRALKPRLACTYREGCPFAAQNFAICMSIFLIKIKQRRAPNGGSVRFARDEHRSRTVRVSVRPREPERRLGAAWAAAATYSEACADDPVAERRGPGEGVGVVWDAGVVTVDARVEHVGSLLRPGFLRDAREAYARGELTPAGLKAAEDRAVREVVAMQEEIGLPVVGDGEMRRESFQSELTAACDGFTGVDVNAWLWGAWHSAEVGDVTIARPAGLAVIAPLRKRRNLAAEEFTFLRGCTSGRRRSRCRARRCSPTCGRRSVPSPPTRRWMGSWPTWCGCCVRRSGSWCGWAAPTSSWMRRITRC